MKHFQTCNYWLVYTEANYATPREQRGVGTEFCISSSVLGGSGAGWPWDFHYLRALRHSFPVISPRSRCELQGYAAAEVGCTSFALHRHPIFVPTYCPRKLWRDDKAELCMAQQRFQVLLVVWRLELQLIHSLIWGNNIDERKAIVLTLVLWL